MKPEGTSIADKTVRQVLGTSRTVVNEIENRRGKIRHSDALLDHLAVEVVLVLHEQPVAPFEPVVLHDQEASELFRADTELQR